jgi:hypothetical protein
MDPEKHGIRSSARENSSGDDFAIDFGDAFPALACKFFWLQEKYQFNSLTLLSFHSDACEI